MKTLKIAFLMLVCCIQAHAQSSVNYFPNQEEHSDAAIDSEGTATHVVIIDADELVSVVPNPASNSITFLNINISGKTLTIFDAAGAIAVQLKLSSPTVDVSNLKPGEYVYQITDEKGKINYRGTFIKQ
ncbi:MAG: T9SS type A sorting domain-containing protein [Chitinophagales bacterium]